MVTESDVVELSTVNVEHLMGYVDEQREQGNAAYQAKRYSDALAAWQRALGAIGQAEGKPMRTADVAVVLRARTILHSNRGQALISMQFWRRAVQELTAALEIEPANAKALWRRYKANEALKAWGAAAADVEALLAPELLDVAAPLLAAAGLTVERLRHTCTQLHEQHLEAERAASESLVERAEDAAAKGLAELRAQFQDVTRRNGLHGDAELATELADMMTRPSGVSVGFLAAVYQIDEDDAEVLMRWTQAACRMRDELGYQSMAGVV